ncbi:MAG: UDP-3-O-(3-hydroxymyristoyl)glucosamine N-acyltransferase [Bacteroidota bacterium]
MQISVAELSALLQGEVVGDEKALLNKVAKIEEGEPGALSFLANPKYEPHLYETKSTAVLVNRNFTPSAPVTATLIKVDDAYASFTALLEQYANVALHKHGIDQAASIHPQAILAGNVYVGAHVVVEGGATIGEGSKIFPQVYVGDRVSIGKNVILYPGVKIYHDCVIGDNCIIHAGTVIGSDGFGFAPLADRSYKKIPQTGNVMIESDVEIGSNCSIDRATMGSTVIRKGVKLDNQIQIAHNVEIGEHTVIASQAGIAGSTKIGKYCVVGGQVGFAGHITIADGSMFGAQSGIASSIKDENGKWFGSPAFEYKEVLKSSVVYKRLPELEKRINELEKLLKDIQK